MLVRNRQVYVRGQSQIYYPTSHSQIYKMHRYYITLHYRHFKRHLHLKWPVVHQQLHVIQNTAHRPSMQASYTASRVRPKRKISCAAAQIAATLTISFPRWRHMSLTSYWVQQRRSSTSYPGQILFAFKIFSSCFSVKLEDGRLAFLTNAGIFKF